MSIPIDHHLFLSDLRTMALVDTSGAVQWLCVPRLDGAPLFGNLVHQGMVYRYHFDDSLHGQEAEFIICRSWLIEALAMMGEKAEAQALLDQMIATTGLVGLIAEEWDNHDKCALGNYPQAYSHLGLINSVCALEETDGSRAMT